MYWRRRQHSFVLHIHYNGQVHIAARSKYIFSNSKRCFNRVSPSSNKRNVKRMYWHWFTCASQSYAFLETRSQFHIDIEHWNKHRTHEWRCGTMIKQPDSTLAKPIGNINITCCCGLRCVSLCIKTEVAASKVFEIGMRTVCAYHHVTLDSDCQRQMDAAGCFN